MEESTLSSPSPPLPIPTNANSHSITQQNNPSAPASSSSKSSASSASSLALISSPSPSITLTNPPLVRHTTRADALTASAILLKAFANDPVFHYLCRNDQHRASVILNLFESCFYQSTLQHNLGYVIHHPHQPNNIAGVALWYPPKTGAVVSSFINWIRYAGLWKLLRIAYTGIQIELAHPKEKCYYLFAVGIDPLAQGMKLAGTLIRELLKKADEEGIPCYLENSNPKNTPIYEHLGFKPIKFIKIGGKSAPPLLSMWREVGGGGNNSDR